MADLGTVGTQYTFDGYIAQAAAPPYTARALLLSSDSSPTPLSSEIDQTFGNAAPSLHQRRAGLLRGIFWPVAAGSRQLAVDCYFIHGPVDTRRPRIHVFPNSALGVQATVVTTVSNNERTWITTNVSVTVAGAGVLEVGLELQSLDHQAECWWDNITPS